MLPQILLTGADPHYLFYLRICEHPRESKPQTRPCFPFYSKHSTLNNLLFRRFTRIENLLLSRPGGKKNAHAHPGCFYSTLSALKLKSSYLLYKSLIIFPENFPE